MPAVKSIAIRNEDGGMVGQRFEPSNEFKSSLSRNYVEMRNEEGRTIVAGKKLVSHYVDKGYKVAEPPTTRRSKDAN